MCHNRHKLKSGIFLEEEYIDMAYKELYQPVHLIIGEGCINEIPRHVEAFGGTKALVVTDPLLMWQKASVFW